MKFDGWPWNTTGYLFYVTLNFENHSITIDKFDMELQSGNVQYGSKLAFFPCDLEIWRMALKNNRAPSKAFNTLRPRQNERLFADDIFKWIFLNENVWISIMISLKFVPKGPINNIPALVQIMAWRRPGGKALSEPMMVSLLTHICVTRPQWVNQSVSWQSASLKCVLHRC